MLKKILVFRTDRIGDLIVNCPSIITIKNYFQNSEITLVASDNNIEYAKSLNIFKNIYSFPRKNLLKEAVNSLYIPPYQRLYEKNSIYRWFR